MVPRELVSTGVPGLDGVLRGGIPRNNVTVVVGPVGSGKTTLGLQFICHGATKRDEPGVVVLFEVSPELITRDASHFGWDLETLEQQGRVKIFYTTRQAFEDELKQPDSVLLAEARSMGARRIFIDSSGPAPNGNGSPRAAFHLLIEGLHREQLSAILSVEVAPQTSSHPFEQFLSDTVICLGADSQDGALTRSLEVVKSRGHDFMTGRHTLDIREGVGLVVYKRAQTKGEPLPPPPQRRQALQRAFHQEFPVSMRCWGAGISRSARPSSPACRASERVSRVCSFSRRDSREASDVCSYRSTSRFRKFSAMPQAWASISPGRWHRGRCEFCTTLHRNSSLTVTSLKSRRF
jgi:KaiC/GvpD/RAD55 family RecA-like ATPase